MIRSLVSEKQGAHQETDRYGRPQYNVASMGPERLAGNQVTRCPGSKPWRKALALTIAAYSLFIIFRLGMHQFNPSCFVMAGGELCVQKQIPVNLISYEHYYDGLFFYRIALNPLSKKRIDHGLMFDCPAYRHQRILYPGTAWLLSSGNPRIVSWLLVAINFLAVSAISLIGSRLAVTAGRSPNWGIAFALYPGLLMALAGDMCDPLASALALGGILAIRLAKFKRATLLLTLAVLAKETTLIFSIGVFADWLISKVRQRQSEVIPAFCWIVPAVSLLLWQAAEYSIWRQIPVLNGPENFYLPLKGLFWLFTECLAEFDLQWAVWILELILLSASALITFRAAAAGSKARLNEKASWFCYFLLALTFSDLIWVNDLSFLRVLTDCYLLGLIILIDQKRNWQTLVVASSFALLWCLEWVHLVPWPHPI